MLSSHPDDGRSPVRRPIDPRNKPLYYIGRHIDRRRKLEMIQPVQSPRINRRPVQQRNNFWRPRMLSTRIENRDARVAGHREVTVGQQGFKKL
ncbi:hypothetical protein [Mycolicibacter kumamotonensis]|jgi:hypothetical protein|uniref:hypothetical protein n=1 Tax=Mycolicibacter kumamotonensis TaxID=354243 RepID=UPI0013FE42D7|nr:hypothetical protein [Mycolicibacter kumamotonensis]